jgi:hypothetical protein
MTGIDDLLCGIGPDVFLDIKTVEMLISRFAERRVFS